MPFLLPFITREEVSLSTLTSVKVVAQCSPALGMHGYVAGSIPAVLLCNFTPTSALGFFHCILKYESKDKNGIITPIRGFAGYNFCIYELKLLFEILSFSVYYVFRGISRFRLLR
jgi:hypothetical protein